MKIQSRYINNAVRIRREYLTCMSQILEKEQRVNKEKKKIEEILEDLKNIYGDMESQNNFDGNTLNDRLLDIEAHIKKVQEEFTPINDKIEKLKIEAKNLNKLLKEKYPELNDIEIKEQLDPHLIKCDEQFNRGK